MALTVPNQGEQIILEALVNKTAPETLVLCLYSNNATISETLTEAGVTEVSGNGYSNITLTGSNWTTTPGAPTEISYPQQTFTFTGAAGNVYGYYVKQATSGKLVWIEAFTDGPYNIQNNGDQIKVTPKITLE